MQELNTLFKSLNEFFSRHKVFSEAEIAMAVSVEVAKLNEETRKRLEAELKGSLEQVLMRSITLEPISVYSPSLTSRKNYLGETFYHRSTHDFLADELGLAFKRLAKIKSLNILDDMEDVLSGFLRKSGYDVESRPCAKDPMSCREVAATKGDRTITVFVIPSIVLVPDYLDLLDPGNQYVMAVPTEKSPAPFINFYRDAAEGLEDKKLQVWVVNVEKKAVNPLLGATGDEDIHMNFENPDMASRASRIYAASKGY